MLCVLPFCVNVKLLAYSIPIFYRKHLCVYNVRLKYITRTYVLLVGRYISVPVNTLNQTTHSWIPDFADSPHIQCYIYCVESLGNETVSTTDWISWDVIKQTLWYTGNQASNTSGQCSNISTDVFMDTMMC